MTDIKNLHETINTQKEALKNFNPEILDIPLYISNNLKHDFYYWQKEAIENFLYYQNPKSKLHRTPTHLMFNMATGTGKTLIMASMILYYYKQGYRHFIFFVNQNNIVDKTENNFINNTHTKYLFKEKIIIDDKTVSIKKVDTFSDNPQSIEIKFTSIQKFYNDIHLQKENQTTLNDLHSKNIVMLSDEAHHLNTDTKNKKQKEQELNLKVELTNRSSEKDIERKGWEHTVVELILNKNNNNIDNKNVLLEFTATIPENVQVLKKYEDKIIYKFGLKEFLQAGYTKEINLISSTFDKKERVLQALIFQWYRHKISIKNNISNFKPVILFRSKTINESKEDFEEFLNWINNIQGSDFDFLKNIEDKIKQNKTNSIYEQGKTRTEQVLNFINKENIRFSEIADWLKNNFKEKNIIITNSKTNKTKKEKTDDEVEKLLNNLEDKNNHIRAIFTVNRLTEGWDVLNLFDIVRLYQGQNAGGSTQTTPEATIKEKQLIGRGVRYFPFNYQDKLKNKRKFDEKLDSELRVLEELYYYTYDEDSKYISHLKKELRKDGYIKDDKVIQAFKLKDEFIISDFYKNTKIFYNKQIDNPNRKKNSLNNIKDKFEFTYKLKQIEQQEEKFSFSQKEEKSTLNISKNKTKILSVKFEDIERHIFLKAVNIKAKQQKSLFQFKNLKKELNIKSIEDLQTKILADFEINIIANNNLKYDDISGKEKLDIVINFLDKFAVKFKILINPKIGTEFTAGNLRNFFKEPKIKSIDKRDIDNAVSDNKWYVLDSFAGTSEEKEVINFIQNSIGNLENQYSEIYLLRNEEVYKIYDFEKGRGFQPDFILFLKSKDKKIIKQNISQVKSEIYYQIFIEPKGSQFLGEDGTFKTGKEGWKEKFLEQISKKSGFENIIKSENPNYRLIGIPFFNTEHNTNFSKYYKKLFSITNKETF
ncbi:MAG: DEAD/DEAH box helicase family protein [Bacteroidetes bacterium]|nr:DEAD/DEAH box helicase family protein [Bacteroidota bacterium]